MRIKKTLILIILFLLILLGTVTISVNDYKPSKTVLNKKNESVSEITTDIVEITTIPTTDEITTETTQEVTSKSKISITDYEADMLLRIGMCEAGGESIECIAAVMCVVLNRVNSNDFPNNIYDVIYEKKQFDPVTTGWFETVEPKSNCYEALNLILDGWDHSQGALYFESCEGESWHSRNLTYLFSIGTMNFYK